MSENNNNIFYQLREQDTNTQGLENGDFVCKLQRPMVLNEGDQLQINKAVIDSREESGNQIVLENETEFSFTFTYYLTNYLTGTGRKDASGSAAWTTAQLDQEPYVLCESSTSDIVEVKRIQIPQNKPGKAYSGIEVFDVKYTDTNGTERIAHIKFAYDPSDPNRPNPDLVYWDSDLNGQRPDTDTLFTARDNVFEIVMSQSQQDEYNINGQLGNATYTTDTSGGVLNYEPVIIKKQFSLEGGIYDYTDFAQRINENMTEINENEFLFQSDPTANTLLTTTGSAFYDISGGTGAFQRGAIFVRANNPDRAFKLEPDRISSAGDFWLGTSQFVLEYDQVVDSFYFQYLNLPFYGGTEQALKYQEYEAGSHTPAKYRIVNKYGGILLDSIQERDLKTGENLNIFKDVLKFNLNTLCPNPNRVSNSTAVGSPASFPKYDLLDKINTTGANTSVDSAVIKSATFYNPPNPATDLSDVITDQQDEIYAAGAIGKTILDYGYFVIELRGLEGDLITENDIKKNVFGIISRYYTSNNYTIGSTEDAIIYTHIGATQYLNELRIRILDSNYDLADGIGSDNTVFLQHIKAKIPIQEQEQKK